MTFMTVREYFEAVNGAVVPEHELAKRAYDMVVAVLNQHLHDPRQRHAGVDGDEKSQSSHKIVQSPRKTAFLKAACGI
jgi:hypothetical protein